MSAEESRPCDALPPEPKPVQLAADLRFIAGVVLAIALMVFGAVLVGRTPSAPRPAAEPLPIVGSTR